MGKQLFLFSLIAVLTTSHVPAQVTDTEGWLTLGYDHTFNKNWSASFETEVRQRNGLRDMDQYFAETGVEYDLNRYVALGIDYRFIQKPDDGEIETTHRWNGDLTFGIDVNRFELSSRSRYQMRAGEVLFSPKKADRETFRNRIQIEYDIRKSDWKPEVSVESYWRLGEEESFRHKQMRYTAGVDYRTRHSNRISVFVRLEQEYNAKNPDRLLIFGAGYKLRN